MNTPTWIALGVLLACLVLLGLMVRSRALSPLVTTGVLIGSGLVGSVTVLIG